MSTMYIRRIGGRMNIFVCGQALQAAAHRRRPLGVGLLLLLAYTAGVRLT